MWPSNLFEKYTVLHHILQPSIQEVQYKPASNKHKLLYQTNSKTI